MKLFLTSIILLAASAGLRAQGGIYGITFSDMGGIQHTVGDYQGQKIWLVVLPATQTGVDSAFLQRVDSVALANAGQVKTVCVPSYEDGYSDSLQAALQPFYVGLLGTSVTITQGMYTHQASGGQQHPLFAWLTHVSGNTHFEEEVGGAGEMYFVDTQGSLYGVYGPEAMYSNKVLNNALQ
jgi:hypothetical protein